MMWNYGGGLGAWMMFLSTIVVVVVVVVAVIFLVRGTQAGGQASRSAPPEGSSAKDILKRRYAAGEIERDEFQQRLRDLES